MTLTRPVNGASAGMILFISVHKGFPIGFFIYTEMDTGRGSEVLVHNILQCDYSKCNCNDCQRKMLGKSQVVELS